MNKEIHNNLHVGVLYYFNLIDALKDQYILKTIITWT